MASITAGSAYAGGSVPLSFMIAFIAVLFTIVAIHQYSKKVSHAGGYYAYVSRSAGPFLGIFTGMLLLGYQITDLAFLPLFFVILVEYSLQYMAGAVLSVAFIFRVRTKKPEEYKNAGQFSTTD